VASGAGRAATGSRTASSRSPAIGACRRISPAAFAGDRGGLSAMRAASLTAPPAPWVDRGADVIVPPPAWPGPGCCCRASAASPSDLGGPFRQRRRGSRSRARDVGGHGQEQGIGRPAWRQLHSPPPSRRGRGFSWLRRAEACAMATAGRGIPAAGAQRSRGSGSGHRNASTRRRRKPPSASGRGAAPCARNPLPERAARPMARGDPGCVG